MKIASWLKKRESLGVEGWISFVQLAQQQKDSCQVCSGKVQNKTCLIWYINRKKNSMEPLSNASKINSGLLSAILDSATCSMFLLEGISVLYLLDLCPQHRQNCSIEFSQI